MNLEKTDNYYYNDGTFIVGTRVVLLHNTHLNEIDPKYIGQSCKVTGRMVEYGEVIYDILFDDKKQHIVFHGYVEIDKTYYRKSKIDDILNEKI